MVAHALLGIFVMGCLVNLMESCVIRCPEQAEWNIRAEIQCQNTTKYFCLYNDIDYTYKEGCTGPDWDRPGSKRVYSWNFNRAPCNDTRYQPIAFVTNGNSDCIFRKSLCTEEGQILFTNGTMETDSTCRCDYKQGYAFVTVPRNKCSCRPSEEDCSCYLKKCQGIGYYLSADYECTNDITKKTDCPLMSENLSEDPHTDMAPTGTPREYDSYAIKRTFDAAILALISLFVMIVITMCIVFQQRLPRCPRLSTEQNDGMDNPWCTSAWKDTQALEILAVVMISLQMFMFRDRRIPKLAGISCCFIGGVFILIDVIVYGTQEGIDKNSFHFAFEFCILAAIGIVIAIVLLIVGYRLACTAESRTMDTGVSLNTIEQNASNDESGRKKGTYCARCPTCRI